MIKTAYIFSNQDARFKTWLREHGFRNLITDKDEYELLRPNFHRLVNNLNLGDTLAIESFSNAVRGIRQMTLLLEICRLKGIRLISYNDGFDSDEKSSFEKLPEIMGRLSLEISALRKSVKVSLNNYKRRPRKRFSEEILLRNQTAINMYIAAYSIATIIKVCKISRASLFRILRRNNIPLRG